MIMIDPQLASTIINAGAGITSLYLALQIKLTITNHETRLTTLEKPKPRRKPSRKRS